MGELSRATAFGVTRTPDDVFIIVFAGIGVILITARLLGWVFARIGQPSVVGEVVGGIVLGPSILGLFPGDLSEHLFPPDIQPYFRIVAQLGLVIYMFIVGLELDTRVLSGNRAAAVSISLSSVTVPFLLGGLAGYFLYPSHDAANKVVDGLLQPVHVDRLPFVLFCGLAISGSAFAILARILDERGLFRTRMGTTLMGCAVVDDIAVWTLAAVVLAIAASSGVTDIPATLGGLAAFILVLFFVVRPLLAKVMAPWYERQRGLSPDLFALILMLLLASACYTTWLGISPILGSFLFGAALPREGTTELFRDANEKLESVSVLVLLPVFFVVTGLGVDLSELGLDGLGILVLYVVIATSGKLIGAAAAATRQGFTGRRAGAVGLLMNTRGLTELAILTLGRDLGVLDTTMFTVLVTTAVSTTMLAGPMLKLVYPDRLIAQDIADAERARLAETDAYRVLLLVSDPDAAGPAVDLATALAAGEPGAEVVISRIELMQSRGELGSGFLGDIGAMATSLDAVRELSARVTACGVRAVPLSQFTDDIARDLLGQVERARPNLVLLPAGDLPGAVDAAEALAERVVREGRVDVAVIRPTADPLTAIRLTSGPEPAAALAAEIAVRLGRGSGVPVLLGGGRRSGALATTMAELGVVLSDDPGEAERRAGVVTVGPTRPQPDGSDAAFGGPWLRVQAAETTSGRRSLDALRARLMPPASTP